MRVYLDDLREAPAGWTRTYSAPETISLLEQGGVCELSLDHDLGDDPSVGTGYDVLVWIEARVADGDFHEPEIVVHSANPVARQRMEAAIRSIKRISGR